MNDRPRRERHPHGRIPHDLNRNGHDPDGHDPDGHDQWEIYARSLDLTIEGQRLIAQEIGYEMKLLWRAGVGWLRDMAGSVSRGRSSPPV